MHQSAMFYGKTFFQTYANTQGKTVLDIGSQNVNGSLRDVCPKGLKYIGVDFVAGDGVDIILEDPYALPFENNSVDYVVCSSCFEHSDFFWLVFLEILRVLKPDGIFYLNVPSNGFIHRWPADSWRFYPDAGHSLVKWGERNGYTPALLESFIGTHSSGWISEGGMWNDFVAIILKDKKHQDQNSPRMLDSLKDIRNGYRLDRDDEINPHELSADFQLLSEQAELLAKQHADVSTYIERIGLLDAEISSRDEKILLLNQDIDSLKCKIADQEGALRHEREASAALRQLMEEKTHTINSILNSRSWRIASPLRVTANLLRRISTPTARINLPSRIAMAICALPATYFMFSGAQAWIKSAKHLPLSLRAVLANPHMIKTRLVAAPRPIRLLTSFGITLALKIQANHGLLPLLRKGYHLLSSEGLRGIYARLHNEAPSEDFVTSSNPPNYRKILVADYRIPRADVSAGERATVGILSDLKALGYEVVFIPNNFAPSEIYEEQLTSLGVEVITSNSQYRSPAHYIRTEGHSFGMFYFIRVDVAESLLDIARTASPQSRVIFHAPDLYFLRESRQAALQGCSESRARAEQTRVRELSMMRKSDLVVVVSDAEAPILQKELPETPVSVFPALYVPVKDSPAPFNHRRNIFFLGGFAHTPNVGAVEWFANHIWPLVHAKLPDVEFHIIGAEAPPEVLKLNALPGIRVVGFVDDLDPVLSSMRVGVAPLLFGAGIKGKVGMTLGAGVPCICTGIAAEGMHMRDRVHALIENEPAPFAEAVIELYTNEKLWSEISKNGQDLISHLFSDAANRASLLAVLSDAKALPLDLYSQYCASRAYRAIPALPQGQSPAVSIIIPVYNKWDLTSTCINSILETSNSHFVPYEIILADDGSTDETVNASSYYPGIKVVKTEKNVGFLRNCNNAAKHASGEFILLLNNDTIALPNWLSALYELMCSDERIAIGGSKLLYPDGVIQEAGAVLFNDGTAHNVGRGFNRHTPVFNISREVDYISGASILIRKSFWTANGGFDERYKNAYCEDSDLAMTARAQGLKVVYCPRSEIIHLEHQSYADQAPSHNTGLQSHNIAILKDKWSKEFASQHLPVTSWQLAAGVAERSLSPSAMERRATGKLNILYFSPFPSHPASHGNRATIQEFARRFTEMGHSVHFVLLQSNDYTEADLQDMKDAWNSVDVIPYDNPLLANGAPIPFDGWYEDGLGEQIRCLCDKYDIDMVFCSYVFQSKLLEFVPSYVLKVIDTHDKMGNRYEMLKKNGQPLEFFSCTPEEEGTYLQRADLIIARREQESRYFNEVTSSEKSIVIPHVEAPRFLYRDFNKLNKVGIVASANRVNLALVKDCLEKIDQRLSNTNGSCRFQIHIAGQIKEMAERLPAKDAALFNRPWVKMLGYVEDIGDFYRDMDLILSPVTMGTGINVKTVQAMAYGMPLLTTECGSKGIETNDPHHMHKDLVSLVGDLLSLSERPEQLKPLAELSRKRYFEFYEKSSQAIADLFSHPILTKTQIERPTERLKEFTC